MSLSLKAELDVWAAALDAYDAQDFDRALDSFSCIADSSKILTNIGLIYATIGEHETAVEHFVAATTLDPYLAIAHFQCGVSNFLIERYADALVNFEDAHLYLRGNEAINYEQIGLKFKLFSAEILFNKGLTQINLGFIDQGIAEMQQASSQKVTDEHSVIDDAIRDRGDGYTVFSIPVGVLYRPSEIKLKNSKSKDYLGKAKLVAASDSTDTFTEFTGVKRMQQASGDDAVQGDVPDPDLPVLSRSVTVPALRAELASERRAVALERSKTTLQPGVGVRPDIGTILASRRSQSVSNPANAPPTSELSRGNTTRVARPALAPPRAKTPVGAAGGSVAIGGASTGDDPIFAEPSPLRSGPSLRRLQAKATSDVTQHQAPPLPTLGPNQSVPPSVTPTQTGGHLTQFYDTYMDVYTDDPALRSGLPHPQAFAALTVHQDPQQLPPWVQPQSPVREPSNAGTNSGSSRIPSRGANMKSPNTAINRGTSSAGGGSLRRKQTRRQIARRIPMYDEDVDDDYVELANMRVKLHYQGDVRGMTIPPTTTYDEFVERVTTKFGTSPTGLDMKFVDEEGTKISLRDEDDFELAIETAREGANGRSEGKLEVWCTNI